MKKKFIKNNFSKVSKNRNIQNGDIRLNLFSKHPCVVVGKPKLIYPIVNITKSKTTNGKENKKINYVSYYLNYVDFINSKKILNKFNYELLSKNEINDLLNKTNNLEFIKHISLDKIK